MKPSSAKQKGRVLQQHVRDALLKSFPSLEADDIRSNPMGASGEDILLSPAARKKIPFSIECKNVEKLNIWEAIDQASAQNRRFEPLVAFKKNGKEVYVALKLDKFLELISELQSTSADSNS